EKLAALSKKKGLISTRGVYSNNPFTEGAWNPGAGVMVGASFSVLNLWTTSVKEHNSVANSIKVYPNPAHDLITIKLSEESGEVTACVYSIDGKTKGVYNIQKTKATIDTKDWISGMYIISFTGENGYKGSVKVQH